MGDLRDEHLYKENEDMIVRQADTSYVSKTYSISDGDTETLDVRSEMSKQGNSLVLRTDGTVWVWLNGTSNDKIVVESSESPFSLDNFYLTQVDVQNPVGYGAGAISVKLVITG